MQVVGQDYQGREEEVGDLRHGAAGQRPAAWLEDEVAAGMEVLMQAGLNYTPGRDDNTFCGLVESWSWALCHIFRNQPEDVSIQRLRAGFRRALKDCKKWPAPAEFRELIPPAPARPAVPHLPARTAHGFEQLKKIQQMLER